MLWMHGRVADLVSQFRDVMANVVAQTIELYDTDCLGYSRGTGSLNTGLGTTLRLHGCPGHLK